MASLSANTATAKVFKRSDELLPLKLGDPLPAVGIEITPPLSA